MSLRGDRNRIVKLYHILLILVLASGLAFSQSRALQITGISANDVWQTGNTQKILWNSSDIDRINLFYTTDGGNTWRTIASNVIASLGEYDWYINPSVVSATDQARIRITEVGGADNDESPQFKIRTLTLTAPTAGTKWQNGADRVQTITWNSDRISVVTIQYKFEGESNWTTIPGADGVTATDEQFNWEIPENLAGVAQVRIYDADNPQIIDEGNDFTIVFLEIDNVSFNSTWYSNNNNIIRWSSNALTDVKIEYSSDNGSSFNVVTNSTNASSGFYVWQDIPYVASNQVKIRVSDPNFNTIYSDGQLFTIKSLRVDEPASGDVWEIGTQQTVRWSSNLEGESVIIAVVNNGTPTNLATGIDATAGSFNYTVEAQYAGSNKIRVYNDNITAENSGNVKFGSISLLAPTGGEVWQSGSTYEIRWDALGITNLAVEYSINGGNYVSVGNESYSINDGVGSLQWTVPSNVSGQNVKIRVRDYDSGTMLLSTGNAFTIANLVLNSPDGNTVWQSGAARNIRWTSSSALNNVKIEYTVDGENYSTIVNSTSAGAGLYAWVLPSDLSSNSARVRISSQVGDSTLTDISEEFTVGYIRLLDPTGGNRLYGTGTYDIRWESSNSVGLVNIQYSTDNGAVYRNIGSNLPSSGSYEWTVEDIATTAGRVRVLYSNGSGIGDTSTTTFTIATLDVTSPNTGNGYQPGDEVTIEWDATSINDVKIDYSTDDGSNWVNVIASVPAAQDQYTWTVPNEITNQGKIRITDITDETFTAQSQGNYKIATLQVLSPNGGNAFQSGTNQLITYDRSSNIADVNIQYSTNNGQDWSDATLVDTRIQGNDTWLVPDAPTDNALIRVSDAANANIADTSDNVFRIKSLTLVSPNGGNTYLVGRNVQIVWSAVSVDNVKLEYSTDNGGSWKTIQNTLPAAQVSYDWEIPQEATKTALVRVSDADEVAAQILDVSDDVFTITPLNLLSPNGGEAFTMNQNVTIKWEAHASVSQIGIEYTQNNGNSWTQVANNFNASLGTYNWNVPNVVTSEGGIRIFDQDNTPTSDSSEAAFAVGGLMLTSPNGGEKWQVGSTKTITWQNISSVSLVNLEYFDGSAWNTIGTNVDATNESFNWVVPDAATSQALIRISDVVEPDEIFDQSNDVFDIVDLDIDYPTNGLVFNIGDQVNIQWTPKNIDQVRIEYSLENGLAGTWQLLAAGYQASLGTYSWNTTNISPSSAVVIRVSDNTDNTISDISDQFQIRRIRIISPDGNEGWLQGSNRDITWNASGVSNVKLSYTNLADANPVWTEIVASTIASAGSYSWAIPADLASGQLRVKVEDADYAHVSDSSAADFTVGRVEFNNNYTGVFWQAGSTEEVPWTVSSGIQTLDIYYKIGTGNWIEIESDFSAAEGSYNWIIPSGLSSSQVRLGIFHEFGNSFIYDSTEYFTVNSLEVTSPNDDSYWQSGSDEVITWNSTNITNVKLEYFTDATNGWRTIVNSTPAQTGTYTWSLPADLSSRIAKVRVTDADNAAITAESDGEFKIGWVKVNKPATDSVWQANKYYTIEWDRSSSIQFVDLFYNLNNGNWIQIATDVNATTGSYNWQVPSNVSSTQSAIRISDSDPSTNEEIFDDSDKFTLLTLDITTPNTAVNWQAGSVKKIEWNSDLTNQVNLEYTTNNGTDWVSIVSGLNGNLGEYDWTIPADISTNQAKVKIADSDNVAVFDESDNSFIISNLTVTQPDEDVVVRAGDTLNITWQAQFIDELLLFYSLDDGNNKTLIIAETVNANDGEYNWVIPENVASATTQGRIILNYASDLTIEAQSEQFTIKKLQLNELNSQILAGSTQNITWGSDGVATVSIFLSTDGGSTYLPNPVAQNLNAGDGSYNWTAPDLDVTDGRLRIVDVDNQNTIVDVTSNSFTISKLEITSPLDASVWQVDSSYAISWTSRNINNVDVYFKLTSTSGEDQINTSIIPANTGSFNYILGQNLNSAITSSSQSASIVIKDSDNSNISIESETFDVQILRFVYPVAFNETFQPNTTETLRWTAEGMNNVDIQYTTNDGSNWTNIIENYNTGVNNDSYDWLVPNNLTAQSVNLRVRNSDVNAVSAISTDIRIGDLGISYPSGGQFFLTGAKLPKVSWTLSDINLVNIELLRDGNVVKTFATNFDANLGELNSEVLTLPAIASDKYQVKITDAESNRSEISVTSGFFTVKALTIGEPDENEYWQVGTTQNIEWNQSLVNNLNIYFRNNPSANWGTAIASDVAGLDQSYVWDIPDNIETNTAQIKIEDAQHDSLFVVSGQFSISDLAITSPAGGENWQFGKTYTVEWTPSSNLSLVNIYYVIDDDVNNKQLIVADYDASRDSYDWTVNAPADDNVKIRLEDPSSDRALVFANSNSFSVKQLSLSQPSSDILYQSGGQVAINWSAGQINNVDLSYSVNNGSSWNAIAANVDATLGTFNWNTGTLAYDTVYVRVNESGNTDVNDITDAFVIADIQVTAPAPGTAVQAGADVVLTWTSQFIDQVDLFFSEDGNNFTLIENDFDAAVGTYTYTIPGNTAASQNKAKFRVAAAINNNVLAESNPLTITNLAITAPVEGQFVQAGSVTPVNITWTSGGINQINILLSTDGGVSYGTTIVNAYDATTGSYPWVVPGNVTSNTARLKIEDAANANVMTETDYNFNIVSIAITEPVLNQVAQAGENITVKWNSEFLTQLRVKLVVDGNTETEKVVNASSGETQLLIPTTVNSNPAQVVIEKSDDSNISATSDNFTIKSIQLPDLQNAYWQGGLSKLITWSSYGINNVDIYVSTDGGVNWGAAIATDVASADGDNSYNWNIPVNYSSDQVRLRIEDADNSSIVSSTDYNFNIVTLAVTAPVANQEVQTGEDLTVTWTSEFLDEVRVKLLVDGTLQSEKVVQAAAGETPFAIPANVPDGAANIVIERSSDATITASSNNFVIKTLTIAEITKDKLQSGAGQTYNINWTASANVNNVSIQFSTNGGTNWSTIVATLPAVNGTYPWNDINDDHISANARLRIVDKDNENIFSTSNSFIVSKLQVDTITAATEYQIGKSYDLFWTSENVENVKIEKMDGSGSWASVTNNVSASNGTFLWQIENNDQATANAKIRISDVVEEDSIIAVSTDFTLKKLNITFPDADGQQYLIGSTQTITWEAGRINTVSIQVSTNNGQNWNDLATNINAADQQYNWTISGAEVSATEQAKLRIVDEDNLDILSTSRIFSIGNMSITSPATGDVVRAGEIIDINWTSTGISLINLSYYVNGNFAGSIANDVNASEGTYQWAMPGDIVASENVRVRIESAANPNFFAESDRFTVKRLQITSPVSGTIWQAGSTRKVTWEAGGINSLFMYYSTDGGTSWSSDPISIADVDAGEYNWVISDDLTTDQARLRLVDAEVAAIQDTSDLFRITGISVTYPVASTEWQIGKEDTIKWTSNQVTNVNIFYIFEDGAEQIIASGVAASLGRYVWTPANNPPFLSATDNMKIKIENADEANAFSISDQFTLKNLELLTPSNAGISLQVGDSYSISWTAEEVQNIDIDYSSDGGANWNTLVANRVASLNNYSYNWTLTSDHITSDGLIRITDSDNSQVIDESENSFKVSSVALSAPLANSVFRLGDEIDITWQTSSNIQTIQLFYKRGVAGSEQFLSNVNADAGTFTWATASYDDLVASNEYKIIIKDLDDNNIIDEIGNFTIRKLDLVTPNGGELWQAGSSENIVWEQGGVNSVTIEYQDDQAAWVEIVNAHPANTLSYSWNIPNNLISDKLKIRIKDSQANNVADISAADFTVSNLGITSPTSTTEWQAGRKGTISWDNTFTQTGLIDISYSIDGGGNYSEVVTGYEASLGSYKWNIPDVSTERAIIRIVSQSATRLTAVSPEFTIKRIALTSPLGSEVWQSGTNQTISWTSDLIDNVDLYYSSDGGTTFDYLISDNLANGASPYSWAIPPTFNSSESFIKVVDASNDSIYAVNNTKFLVGNVTVTFPNGGELLNNGSVVSILWSGSGSVDFVKIEFKLDNASNYQTLVASTPNDGEYEWNIASGISSDECLIRISDATTGNIIDESDNQFTITALDLIQPLGNAHFQIGETHWIKWSAVSTVQNIIIELVDVSTGDVAPLYETLPANQDSVQWTVPNFPTDSAKIRITDINNPTLQDVSTNPFRIANVNVDRPSLTTKWQIGDTEQILWSKTSNVPDVNILLLRSNSDPTSIAQNVTGTSYDYGIPNVEPESGVKFIVQDAVSGGIINDTSVSITLSKLELTQPAGNEQWTAGSKHAIKWNHSSDINQIRVELSTDNGATFTEQLAIQPTDSSQFYWEIPLGWNYPECKLRVIDNEYANVDDTSNTFSIYSPNISLLSPNGGEYINSFGGNQMKIEWSSSNISIVRLEYSTDNGTTWELIKDNLDASLGEYFWNVQSKLSSSQALVKVADASYPDIHNDESDNTFTFGYVQVLYPTTTLRFQVGNTETIQWENSQSVDNVSVEYSTDDGVNWAAASPNNIAVAPGTNQYNWTVPNTPTDRGLVRVSYVDAYDSIYNVSNNTFKISSISLTNFDGGGAYQLGKTYDIEWNAGALDLIDIYYSEQNDQFTELIASNVDATTGSYSWTIPTDYNTTSTGKIKIQASDAPDVSDESSAAFTIKQLDITQPVAGVKWQSGKAYDITWDHGLVNNVKLSYKLSTGPAQTIIASTPANTGSYNWQIPEGLNDDNVVLIAQDVDAVSIIDTSEVFAIGLMRLTSPNGGEVLQAGTAHNITWLNDTDIETLNLEYQLTPAGNWEAIVSNYPATSGTYEWTIPSDIFSDQARVRIMDANDFSILDESDNVFSIKQLNITAPLSGDKLQYQKPYNITWESSGNVTQLNIEYKAVSSALWTNITTNVDATLGTYAWTPTILPQTIQIRLTDAVDNYIVQISDEVSISRIDLTAPVNGGAFQVDSLLTIEWDIATMSSDIENVQFAYSLDGGVTKVDIVSVPSNNDGGKYNWTITDQAAGNNVFLYVRDFADPDVYDSNDVAIAIKEFEITSPTSATSVQAGGTVNINWSSQFVNTLNAYYKVGNSPEVLIKNAHNANTKPLVWNVPESIQSSSLKIILRDADDNNIVAISEPFSVRSLRLLAPLGANNYVAGRDIVINWNDDTAIQNIGINYKVGNGSWSPVETDLTVTGSTGTYTWTTPSTISSQDVKIQIYDADAGINPVTDSSAAFTVTNLVVTNPLNTSRWLESSAKEITWESDNSIIPTIGIKLVTPTTSFDIDTNEPNNNTFNWASVDTSYIGTQARIKVYDINNEDTLFAFSDYFTISRLKLLEPNLGEHFRVGKPVRISWSSSSDIENVYISLSKDGGSYQLLTDDAVPNTGSYTAIIDTNDFTANAKLRVSDAVIPEEIQATSKQVIFSKMNIYEPQGGENWQIGADATISWELENVSTLRLEYVVNSGSPQLITTLNNPGNSYSWTIPADVPETDKLQIRLSDDNYQNVDTLSNFISTFSAQFNLTSPNGGNRYKAGEDSIFVTWNQSYVDGEMDVWLSTDNFTNDSTRIGAGIQADSGKFAYLPEISDTSDNASIKIVGTDPQYVHVFDYSDAPFTISHIKVTSPIGGEYWQAGKPQNITWESGDIDQLQFAYSTDEGTSWKALPGVGDINAVDGQVSWTPGNFISASTARIKVSDKADTSISDISDNPFVIGWINVLEPVQAEVYQANKEMEIKWNNSASLNEVEIEIIDLTGQSSNPPIFTVSTNQSGNDTVYTLPANFESDSAVVVINASGSLGQITDTSDVFKVKYLEIENPSSGDVWYSNKTFEVTWTHSTNLSNVNVEYSIQEFGNWDTIGTNIDASLGKVSWTIPNNISTDNARVRIYETSDPEIVATSEAFTINLATVKIVHPNGSERINSGVADSITWNSQYVQNLRVLFRENDAADWDTLASSVLATAGKYEWPTVPRLSTSNAKVKLEVVEASNLSDESDDYFTVGWIDLNTPTGGETFKAATTAEVEWEQSASVNSVKLEYALIENPTENDWLAAETVNEYTPGDNSATWIIPTASTTHGHLRVVDNDSPISSILAKTAIPFTISNLDLLTPNGGEFWQTGSEATITFTPIPQIANVKVSLSLPGKLPSQLGFTSGASGEFKFTPNATQASDSARIIIQDAQFTSVIDSSDNYFQIGNLTLTSFSDGERVQVGQVIPITWNPSSNISKVNIWYQTKLNGTMRSVASGVDATAGTYDWLIPNRTSDSCYIIIQDVDNPLATGANSTPFIISDIIITSPNNGELLQMGKMHEIRWQQAYIGDVELQYSSDGNVWESIIKNYDGSLGSYNWMPNEISTGSTYQIRIQNIDVPEIGDTSNNTFTLTKLDVTAPNQDNLKLGTEYDITWDTDANLINMVNIYLLRSGSAGNLELITANVNAGDETFDWQIDQTPEQNARIVIEDADNPEIRDTSDFEFTLADLDLKFTDDVVGRKVQVGKTYNIEWESTFVQDVRIEIKNDNQVNWTPLAASVAASEGSLSWTVNTDNIEPNDSWRMRISAIENNEISEISDSFTISKLEITNPIKKVGWLVGNQEKIEWDSEFVDSVRILLKLSSESQARIVATGVPGSDEIYNWLLPTDIRDRAAKVIIQDMDDIKIVDTTKYDIVIGKQPEFRLADSLQSDTIKIYYDFDTQDEIITLTELRYIREGISTPQDGYQYLLNDEDSLKIQGPVLNGFLEWNSSQVLANYEDTLRLIFNFRSTFEVDYVDTVKLIIDNLAPRLDSTTIAAIHDPNLFGWNNAQLSWEPAEDISAPLKYRVSVKHSDGEKRFIRSLSQGVDTSFIPNLLLASEYTAFIQITDKFGNTREVSHEFNTYQIADFVRDNRIDIEDLEQFISLWNTTGKITSADLYPYNGDLNNLDSQVEVIGDTKLDIDDILVFIRAWNFNYFSSGAAKKSSSWQAHTPVNVERELIKFKKGKNSFRFPVEISERDDISAVSVKIHYDNTSMSFDSLNFERIGSSSTDISLLHNDTTNGVIHIDYGDFSGKIKNELAVSTNLNYVFDRLSRQDSMLVTYTGYSDGKIVVDKSKLYTLKEIPASYKLTQNYPNPFNPTTKIEYDLPESGRVRLVIYNILGEMVTTLVDQEQQAGNYIVRFNAYQLRGGLASGVYFYRLEAGNFVKTKKMVLIK